MILTFNTKETFTNITDDIIDVLRKTPFIADEGACLIYTPHTTCGIAILEDESRLKQDMEFYLEDFASRHKHYRHDDIELRDVPPEERKNGYSHIRAMLFNPSQTIPIENGELMLGKWQSIFLVELDPFREREIYVRFI